MNHTGSFCPIDEQERQKAKEWSACWTASEEDGREASLRTSQARLHSIRSCVSVGDRPSYVQTPSPRASVLPSVGERTGRRRSRLAPAAVEAREETYKAAKTLTQTAAAKLIGIKQPDLSNILRGHYQGFSIERLMRILTAFNQDVEITVRPSRRK